MTTKILALTDALGNLVRFVLLPGQRFDTVGVAPLIDGPIYATPLTLALVESKLEEHGLADHPVVAVKPQVAFFEALGSDGVRALENVCAYARAAGLQVIADAKRGDIGSTARAYAAAYLERADGRDPLADAVTVNPYLGRDSLDPFLAACRRDGAGLFCVVKTSNAGGGEVQDLVLSDGRHVWHQVAELVAEWGADLVGEHGLSAVGAVVGATHPRAVGEARRLLPRSILLLPARRARRRRTSPAHSRAVPPARSSTWPATSSTRFACPGWTGAAPPPRRRRSTPATCGPSRAGKHRWIRAGAGS